MKHLIFWLFTGLAAAAWAQQPAKEAAKPEPAKEAAKPEPATKKAAAKGPRRWNEDARHCLERGSNTEVIKCAEEFL
jgi:pyruvate/2-oxoglutarate dehydrogenase complex dihydrolipoamide acyltransferase (E2) component